MATTRLSAIERTFRDVIDAIAPAPIALIGGLAVSARTEPRFTREVKLIAVRGFSRGRDLTAALASWRAGSR